MTINQMVISPFDKLRVTIQDFCKRLYSLQIYHNVNKGFGRALQKLAFLARRRTNSVERRHKLASVPKAFGIEAILQQKL